MVRTFLSCFVACTLACSTKSFADPSTPVTLQVPNYWSSTNCRANVSTGIFGNRIGYSHLRMSLKDALTGETQNFDKYLDYPDGVLYNQSASIGVTFDSTHFSNGRIVELSAEAWDVFGNHYGPIAGSATVKNVALLASHPDPDISPDPAITVKDIIGPQFGKVYMIRGSWTPLDFVNNLNGASVVFVGTHGTPDNFYAGKEWYVNGEVFSNTFVYPSGSDNYVIGHSTWLQSVGILPRRSAQMGYGYPPYNSTSVPAVALDVIVSCGTGANSDFDSFCYPYVNHYGYVMQDQAFTGFRPSIFTRDEEPISRVIFSNLSAGQTLAYARLRLATWDPPFRSGGSPGELGHNIDVSDMPIHGDDKTRLMGGVYTNNYLDPVGWYVVDSS